MFFIACDVLFSMWKPIYPLDPRIIDLLHELNIIERVHTDSGCLLHPVPDYQASGAKVQAIKTSTDALTGLLNREG